VSTSDVESLIRRGWGVLAPPVASQLASFALPLQGTFGAVRLAVDKAGLRHLLIETEEVLPVPGPTTSVLSLSLPTLVFSGEAIQYFDLRCDDHELFPEFDEVVAEIVRAVIDNPTTPGKNALVIIERWRRLFNVMRQRGLRAEGQVGLFAELSLLKTFLAKDPAAITFWTGPDGLPHDFETEARSIEVKGVGSQSNHIVVHGLDQMAQTASKPLDLALVLVDVNSNGSTLEHLIESVEALVLDVGLFRKKLFQSGYTGQEPRNQFSVSEVRRIRVRDSTPRLTRLDLVQGELASGIDSLSYDVALARLLPISRATTFEALLREDLA
jgi:hypothetical protein